MTNKERQQLWIAVAVGLITMEAVGGIIWLSSNSHDIPPTLASVISFFAGAMANALRMSVTERINGNGTHQKPPTNPSA